MKRFIYSVLSLTGLAGCKTSVSNTESFTNVLLITVDDMNYNSVGVFGCKTPNTTPNIDKLASQGIRFTNAHVQVAVSQPSRNSIATGMYPHKSRLEGFYGFKDSTSIPLVYEVLQKQGFLTGILGKVEHSTPKADYHWDLNIDQDALGYGRDPMIYYKHACGFFAKAKELKKPFYFMTNSHDPHRPFYGSQQESKRWPGIKTTKPSRIFSPSEVVVPAFLPESPDVRLEISEYYSSVRRADDCVGMILQALEESGLSENTLVIFLSDNGMAFPFAKTNCYLNSTKTPMIVRWPGRIKPGITDTSHLVSAMDILPTVFEINGISIPQKVDGVSMLPLLLGKAFHGRSYIFTQFFETSAAARYPMRCIQNTRYGYIFNLWADGKRTFKNESQSGRTFKAMTDLAQKNSEVADRVDFFLHRTVEEFYDFYADPDALHNLISDPSYQTVIDSFRLALGNWMRDNGDSAYRPFMNRGNPEEMNTFVETQQREADIRKGHVTTNE